MATRMQRTTKGNRGRGDLLIKTNTSNSQGYALVEYPTQVEAKAAIESSNGKKLLDLTLAVDFAFVRPEPKDERQAGGGGKRGVRRSRSPDDRKKE